MDIDWNNAIGWSEAAIICATLLGPVLAVQAQKWLERKRNIKERRLIIFRTLMATRAAMLSAAHVEALNAIPVEFYGTKGKSKEINDAWKLYIDHHDDRLPAGEAWGQKRLDLFLDMLHLISQSLGYGFSRAQLERDIYSPRAHGELETEQTIIRKGIVKLLNGEATLPMSVVDFPATADEATLANQVVIADLLVEVLRGERSLKLDQGPQDE
ncbi:hypothetical protein DC366_00830 [Pelagivirga sediminicola]|uniref:DUF6680 domain-containing protein n=1 Tax=Pelagivirga sediminicola TaxID=2170575 RepID=A0A2T7GAY6_9RHOB|nr:DUF6680 family protein [Pelagivirga sediminicola]PVA11548.1 hypothetical protein DC366_00830 [Pelagivirga sediminicola]